VWSTRGLYATSEGYLYKLEMKTLPENSYPSNVYWNKYDTPFKENIVHISAPITGDDVWVQSQIRGIYLSDPTKIEEMSLSQIYCLGHDRDDLKIQSSHGNQNLTYLSTRGWVPSHQSEIVKMIGKIVIVLK
jgi:hypothetical protein